MSASRGFAACLHTAGRHGSARSWASWLVKLWAANHSFSNTLFSASSQGLVLANSILQELSCVHDKSSSCSSWNGCGQGETHPYVPLEQHSAWGMGWAQRWRCFVLSTNTAKSTGWQRVEEKGAEFLLFDVALDAQGSRTVSSWGGNCAECLSLSAQRCDHGTGLCRATGMRFISVAAPKGYSGIALRALTTPFKKICTITKQELRKIVEKVCACPHRTVCTHPGSWQTGTGRRLQGMGLPITSVIYTEIKAWCHLFSLWIYFIIRNDTWNIILFDSFRSLEIAKYGKSRIS